MINTTNILIIKTPRMTNYEDASVFESAAQSVPQSTAWYLADLGEYLGKQELYARQAPQKLKALKEHAIIESAVSSNRIEGVTIDPARVKDVVFGRAHYGRKRVLPLKEGNN